mmetsp:Transcript_34935/g.59346  ORF Transcript_34935/g.59346 Transcript_34935/m.59346 type:complete len:229 (-) Transcript_34935:575-1261(-)
MELIALERPLFFGAMILTLFFFFVLSCSPSAGATAAGEAAGASFSSLLSTKLPVSVSDFRKEDIISMGKGLCFLLFLGAEPAALIVSSSSSSLSFSIRAGAVGLRFLIFFLFFSTLWLLPLRKSVPPPLPSASESLIISSIPLRVSWLADRRSDAVRRSDKSLIPFSILPRLETFIFRGGSLLFEPLCSRSSFLFPARSSSLFSKLLFCAVLSTVVDTSLLLRLSAPT